MQNFLAKSAVRKAENAKARFLSHRNFLISVGLSVCRSKDSVGQTRQECPPIVLEPVFVCSRKAVASRRITVAQLLRKHEHIPKWLSGKCAGIQNFGFSDTFGEFPGQSPIQEAKKTRSVDITYFLSHPSPHKYHCTPLRIHISPKRTPNDK